MERVLWVKTHKHLVNGGYRCFCLSNVVTICSPQGSLLFGVQKFSLQDCPKLLLHLFEEDTLVFLLAGKLWLTALYQVVIFKSEICQFYAYQKLIK